MHRALRLQIAGLLFVASAACTPSGRGDPLPVEPSAPNSEPAPTATPGAAATARAPDSPDPPASPCGPARELATADQLLAALSPEWPRPGVGRSPVSVDLIATVDLVASSDRLPLPSYCGARCTHDRKGTRCEGTGDPCRAPVRFRLNDPVAGVQVDGQTHAREGTELKAKAGSRFRLVQRVHEFHPETPYYDPVITVALACDVPCKAEERRCPATSLCVPTQDDGFCLLCDGLSRPECACRTPEGGLKADGAQCTYLSGDYFPAGSCAQGRCAISH